MSIWLGLALIAALCAAWLLFDMARFGRAKHKAEHPKAGIADAGGLLYIQGGKTYYKMPKSGTIRKIADYPMDLRPGSPDMVEFTRIMDQARAEHMAEVRQTKMKAEAAMRDTAKLEAEAEARDAD